MSARTVTVEAYTFDELPDPVRELLIEDERMSAWEGWVTDEVGAILVDQVASELDGVADVDVTAWALDYHEGAVVEGHVADAHALAAALGLPGHDVGDGLTLDPYHGQGVYPGHTYVLRHDPEDGPNADEALTSALAAIVADALRYASAWAEDVTSDYVMAERIEDRGHLFDRRGRVLDAIIVDAPEEVVA